MAVSIRLRRMGRKKQPHYRIVVAESEHPRDGRFVESLGFYQPLTQPARLVLDLERVDHWLGQGAQPSGTVKSLIGKARRGGDEKVVLGAEDVRAEKAKRAELLAERRRDERRQAEKPLTQVPQDTSSSPGGSSSEDATAAEAMAEGEARAVREAEDDEPNAPRESMVRSSAEVEGDVRPKHKPKVAGAEGEEGA